MTVLGLLACACVALGADTAMRPHIKDVRLEGTNVVITVSMAAGFERLVVETTLEEPPKGGTPNGGTRWEERLSMALEKRAGDFTFRLPRMGQMQLVRVRADGGSETAVSGELSYVEARPERNGNEVVLRIRGKLDGTDRVVITREGAVWEHVSWDWPQGPVWFNDVQWIPRDKNVISASLPEHTDFSAAKLERVRGRDVVALEHAEQRLIIHVADTLNGADDYEFRVRMPVRDSHLGKQEPGPAATLKITARIDGSDQLRITASGAQWKHLHWEWPAEVRLNGVPWLPSTNATLGAGFLRANVNFATARVIERKGRDLVTAEAMADAVVVHFADNPAGADDYSVTLQFGP